MDRDAFFAMIQAVEPGAKRCKAVTEWPDLDAAMAAWDEMVEAALKENRRIC